MGLRVIKGNKIDHQRKTSKDLSDAVVGAVYNVIKYEKQMDEVEIEVFFGESEEEQQTTKAPEQYIAPPSKPKKMPKDLAAFISARQDPDKEPEEVFMNLPDPEVDLEIYIDGKQVV